MDGQIWALKADSLTSPLIVTVTVTEFPGVRESPFTSSSQGQICPGIVTNVWTRDFAGFYRCLAFEIFSSTRAKTRKPSCR